MADSQFQLDTPPSFEIPKAGGVNVSPAATPNPAAGGAGYIGKGGAGAAIAASVLEGWMQGTRVKEERMRQQAQDKLSGSRYLYANSVQQWQDWRSKNPTPDAQKDPQGFAKWQQQNMQFKNAVTAARDSYTGVMEQYVAPEQKTGKDGKPKKPSIGKRLEKGFTAQSPEMFPQKILDAFKQMPVDQMGQPDPEQAARLEAAKTQTEAEKQRLESEKLRTQTEKQMIDANKTLADAAKSNDYDKMAQAMNTVNALSGRADKIITADMLKAQAQETKLKAQQSATLGGIFSKVDAGKPLTDNEQAIYNASWGIPPDKQVFQAYLDEAGPGKRFANRYEAAKAFLSDQNVYKNAYRPDTQTEMVEGAMRVYLREKLGRDPTPGELSKGILDYKWGSDETGGSFKPEGAGGKISVQQSRQAVSRAIESMVGKNDDYKDFALPSGSATGGVTYGFRPDYQSKRGWFKDKDEVEQNHEKFMNDVSAYLSGQGYTDEQIRQMMGAARFGMDEKPQPGQPQTNVTPKAQPLSNLRSAGAKPYILKRPGKPDTEIDLSPDQVDAAHKNAKAKGWVLQSK